jgi:hypothetical protein
MDWTISSLAKQRRGEGRVGKIAAAALALDNFFIGKTKGCNC